MVGIIAFWWLVVAAWFATGFSTGMLPLSEGLIRSPAEALLKFTRFAPCFLPGLVAYKLWYKPRAFPAFYWPVFLAGCCALFVWVSGSQPIEAGWLICFAIGLGVCFFREMRSTAITGLTKHIARYSYGIYLLHYFAIWGRVCRVPEAECCDESRDFSGGPRFAFRAFVPRHRSSAHQSWRESLGKIDAPPVGFWAEQASREIHPQIFSDETGSL